MKRSSQKSGLSRKKMIQAAGAAFREHGVGGVGVDGLAKAADFTSGAFYFHFRSKLDAFVATTSTFASKTSRKRKGTPGSPLFHRFI